MDLTDLQGARLGPVPHEIARSRVADFVAATADDPDRWEDHAPPGYAAAVLFTLAPSFLWSSEVLPFTRVLIHSEQRFTWHRPFAVGDALRVEATVASVRHRAGAYFVGFETVASGSGGTVVESSSTFLMGAERPGGDVVERPEPAATARAECALASSAQATPSGVTLAKSASRADLVRYAAASGDYNPLHWDHETAVAAGVPGIIVHGLLMASWMGQVAAAFRPADPAPLAEMRVRFRNPLYPSTQATVTGVAPEPERDRVDVDVRSADELLVSGRATLRGRG